MNPFLVNLLTKHMQNHCIIPTMHGKLLQEAIVKSNVPPSCNDFSVLPQDSPFGKFLVAMKQDVNASRLYKKILKWFKGGRQQRFDYRFTGKDSRSLSHPCSFFVNAG